MRVISPCGPGLHFGERSLRYYTYWDALERLFGAREVLQTPFFLNYERPLFVFLSSVWPHGHIAFAITLFLYWLIVCYGAGPHDRHVKGGGADDAVGGLIGASLALAIFITVGTWGGTAYEKYLAAERTYGAAVPRVLPQRPQNREQLWADVDQRSTAAVAALNEASNLVRVYRMFIELASPLLFIFVCMFFYSLRYFFFAFVYAREIARPHLPTEIVDRALSGERIDNTALANVLTQSTAPVVKDSLADKIERERLAALANRLQADTSALNDKLSKETEIARLVVDHARKREELADMEKKLRNMGVKRDG